MSRGIEEAKTALVSWFKERAKDHEILGEPIMVMMFVENERRQPSAPVFSDRFDPKVMRPEVFVDILLGAAENECGTRGGSTRFAVAMRGDSRVRRFTLHAADDVDETLASDDDLLAVQVPPPATFAAKEVLIDRLLWALFAAAAISNTATMVKPTTDDKPTMPKGTGGRTTVASRQYTAVAADTVAQYATRVANEMLKSYRERWKKAGR